MQAGAERREAQTSILNNIRGAGALSDAFLRRAGGKSILIKKLYRALRFLSNQEGRSQRARLRQGLELVIQVEALLVKQYQNPQGGKVVKGSEVRV